MQRQKDCGAAREISPDMTYGDGLRVGGRWFVEERTRKTWRLLEPDYPFRGLFEEVPGKR